MKNQETLCINTLRCLSIDMVQQAKSGHPGMPLGMAPIMHVLFSRHLKFCSSNSDWPSRDRFVLSNGHGCALLYSILHLTGFKVTLDDLKNFRQSGSNTPGHPEMNITDGVEATTGPLGQGIANAVGMAIAQEHVAACFNTEQFPIADSKIYVFCGDGCLQEGLSSECCSLAGHLKLKNLILIYDDNQITIDGNTSLSFSEDIPKRFESCGWNTITVDNGNEDLEAMNHAIRLAQHSDKPTIISLKTRIGYKSPLENTAKAHGAPLGDEGVIATKKALEMDSTKKFHVPKIVSEFYSDVIERGNSSYNKWQNMFELYSKQYPDRAQEFNRIFIKKELPVGWKKALKDVVENTTNVATRVISSKILKSIAKHVPELIGGCADLTPSCKTRFDTDDFQPKSYHGRYIRFGVREHGMIAICNGISYYGGLIPFSATFLNFITYAWGAVRVGALSHIRQIYIMTHDSIALGEDGPTHQPIEVLPLLRATPNLITFRPADLSEVIAAYEFAIESRNAPVVIVLTRQSVPTLQYSDTSKALKGAYILQQTDITQPDIILIASGSEVSLIVEASSVLEKKGLNVRVVSCPSLDLFDQQILEYRRTILPIGIPVISVEASSTIGWSKYSHSSIGMTTFGASAPGKENMKNFGFSVENIVDKTISLFAELSEQGANFQLSYNGILGLLECQRR